MPGSNNARRKHRHFRMRHTMIGTKMIPRLTVFKSHRHFSCQLIDDDMKHTVTSFSSLQLSQHQLQLSRKAQVVLIGQQLAKQAQALKIKKIVFDRSGYLYTGLIKLFADTLRSNGLAF